MPIIVQKYGGSSLATPEKIWNVARRIVAAHEQGLQVVAVVSAMGKTTDKLLELAASVTKTPDGRELDMLLTVGERISMSLLSMAIRDLGHPAVSFTGSQSGIITTDQHQDARIIRVTPLRILDALEKGAIVIVAGFQGVSEHLEITSLGRGGSDTTAVALAAALNASYAEICSDVDGVYSADPRVIENPIRTDELDYETMQCLADRGAKVLNAEAVEWARSQHVEIRCSRTTETEPGTRIRQKGGLSCPRVTAVTKSPKLIVAQGKIENVSETFEDDLDRALTELGISGTELIWAGEHLFALIPTLNLHSEDSLRQALSEFNGIELHEDWNAISVVGRSLSAPPSVAQKARVALSGIQRHAHLQDASRLTWLVNADQADEALRRLHSALIEQA